MCVLPGRPRGYSGKESLASAGDTREAGLHPGLGRLLQGGHGHPLQDSCLENSKDRAARWAAAHAVTQSHTWLNTQAHALSTLKAELYRHLEFAHESPEFHVKMQMRNRWLWGRAGGSVFLTSSQVMGMVVVHSSHLLWGPKDGPVSLLILGPGRADSDSMLELFLWLALLLSLLSAYIMVCLGEPCPSDSLWNWSAFVQDRSTCGWRKQAQEGILCWRRPFWRVFTRLRLMAGLFTVPHAPSPSPSYKRIWHQGPL